MKKHFLTLITALLLLAGGLLVCGCEKEPPPPPEVEPELQPTLELSVTPEGEIPYGDGLDIRWTADNNTNKVVLKVNGKIKETRYGSNSRNGAFYIDRLFKDALVTIVATNVNLSVEEEKEVHVGDWTSSTFGLVSYFPWKYKSQTLSSLDGKLLATIGLTEEEKSWVFYYHKNGTRTFSNHPNITESWYIKNDSTLVYNGVERKLEVDEDEMTISYQTTWNSQQVWFNMVFEHASDVPTDPD
jgi:hypothetical protein